MSGVVYSTKNLLKDLNGCKDVILNNEEEKMGDQKINFRNTSMQKLLEYENMVSSAESKCSQLKGQLEQIKQFYSNHSQIARKNRGKFQKTSKSARGRIGSQESITTLKIPKLIRQNSHSIGTDSTGAALGTINNILAGITKSIEMPKPNTNPSIKIEETKSNLEANEDIHGVEQVQINSKSRQSVAIKSKIKFANKKSNSRIIPKSSSHIFKKYMKKSSIKIPEKRNTTSDNHQLIKNSVPMMNERSRKILNRSRYLQKNFLNRNLNKRNHDLVEIYHNTAVKESKSSESDVPKKRLAAIETKEVDHQPVLAIDIKPNEIVPPLNIDEDDDKLNLANKGIVSCLSRNYEMPTISSRMKQVAKYYMSSFNIKTIPFCAAISTGPSHNIGINIQQVMNMVKTKQAPQQLSPTLAYNIGLAAGKWEDNINNPISVLVSNVTSRTIYSHCPLSRSTVNYQHLQEIAKTIPQEIIEEDDENEEAEFKSPESQSIIITGPSGDVKVSNRKQTIWTVNEEDNKKCTCVPQRGNEFQQIINKFNGSSAKSKVNRPLLLHGKLKELKRASPSEVIQKSECIPLQNKEKKLKEVLGKLHDEFESMTNEYDELLKKHESTPEDEAVLKDIEKLDKELNSKEEEIVMVMTLYKEVLALKQQVKVLKDRSCTSRENVHTNQKYTSSYDFAATDVLNKLLRRIQHFQTHYKRN